MKTFVTAEIGVNHNGSLDLALKLIEEAAKAGAQAAKFQSFTADTIVTPNTDTVGYQKASGAEDQHAMLRALELSDEDHRLLAAHCEACGIEFMSTAFDRRSLDLLCDIGVKRIKIPSGEITNIPYLQDCASRGLPIILSTGMADLEEVKEAAALISQVQLNRDIAHPALTVLHCTSAYPTDVDDVNLLAMQTLARELGLPVGYSDHTDGVFAAPIAVALGARVIEKHVTLDRTMNGPDHAASIEPHELANMITAIDTVETLLGDGVKQPRPSEFEARRLVRRGLKAARPLPAGTILTAGDVSVLRPATGLVPKYYATVVGSRTTRELGLGEPIELSDLER